MAAAAPRREMSSYSPLTLAPVASCPLMAVFLKCPRRACWPSPHFLLRCVKLPTVAPLQPLWLFHSTVTLPLPWESFLQSPTCHCSKNPTPPSFLHPQMCHSQGLAPHRNSAVLIRDCHNSLGSRRTEIQEYEILNADS